MRRVGNGRAQNVAAGWPRMSGCNCWTASPLRPRLEESMRRRRSESTRNS